MSPSPLTSPQPANQSAIGRRRRVRAGFPIVATAAAAAAWWLAPVPAKADSANTAAVTAAANAFMAPLSSTQKTPIDAASGTTLNTSCLYNFTLANVEVWSNLPVSTTYSGTTRNGLIFSGLSATNQTNALAVASTALSTTGKKLLDDVRAADRYISGEVPNAKGTTSSMWSYNKYFIAFVGAPSTSAPWTFQFGGHHLAYNITYNGDYTSGTPIFAGNEPNSWTDSTGTYAPLGAERSILESLRPTLTTSALLSGTFSDVVFGANGTGPGSTSNHDTNQPKSYPTTGRGQLYSALTSTQQAYVRSYLEAWVNYLAPSIAAELLAIYESPQALAETYVGYAGSNTLMRASNNYFRVDGPRLWIEFSVQGGVYDMSSYHDHGLVRDKLADYGAAYGSTTISTTVRPPTISAQPATQTATISSSATLSVTAASAGTGTATLSYQWFKDGVAISGATASSYTIASAASSDAGAYSVWVISTGGLTKSATAILTVDDPYADFLATYQLTGAAATDDSDGDGISLLLEFVLGGNPTVASTSILPAATVDANGALVLTFHVTANLGNVTWAVEYSSDLAGSWTTAVNGQNGVTITSAPGDTGYYIITATIPNTSGASEFARLRVTKP